MQRIAIDYTPAFEQSGGIGRYVRELTAALAVTDRASEYRLFVSGAAAGGLPAAPAANFRWRPTAISPRWLARIWQRARLPLPVELFTGKVDLFHATDFVLPYTLAATRTLLTVHDLSFVRVPEAASPPLKAYLDAVVPRSVARADHILADSAATKDDLIELYGTPADKITVLYSGVDQCFRRLNDRRLLESTRSKYGLADVKYILSVGTVQPRKNYSRVIRALAEVQATGLDLHYAIAGGKGWLEDEMRHTIASTGMGDIVHVLGYVDDEDLPALYSEAQMLLMPSLYEGFGLPVLEAMACGVAVITSKFSSLPEVAGDAAILLDPTDIAALRDAIIAVETDLALHEQMVRKGYRQAEKFTWRRSAAQLLLVYRSLLDE